MTTQTSATNQIVLESDRSATLVQAFAEFVIRRRILISAIVVLALIGELVARGIKPGDVFNVHDPWSVAGALLVVAGVALRSWAAGILRKDSELTTTGPYRLIRNPLYVGSFMMMFGFCALLNAAGHVWYLLLPMVVLYFVKVRHEERLLARLFPAEWADYERRTPRFVPRFARVDLTADWRIAQWRRSREYQALGATLAALAALATWHLTGS